MARREKNDHGIDRYTARSIHDICVSRGLLEPGSTYGPEFEAWFLEACTPEVLHQLATQEAKRYRLLGLRREDIPEALRGVAGYTGMESFAAWAYEAILTTPEKVAAFSTSGFREPLTMAASVEGRDAALFEGLLECAEARVAGVAAVIDSARRRNQARSER